MATSDSSVTLADRVAAVRLDRRLDVTGARPGYLAVAGNGAHVRLSSETFRLLDALRAGVRLEEIAGALNTRPGRRPVTVDELSAAARRAVDALERAAAGTPGAPAGFWGTRPLLSAAAVAREAAWLTGLFTWPAAALAGAAVAAVLAAAPAGWFSLDVGGGAFAAGYGLFLVSLVAHEFGHAAACRRFGLAPGAVGVTMYLVFPALYTDVTRTWRLPRRQRVVVDLGGNYVQALAGAAYLAFFGATGAPAFGAAATLVALSMAFSLNPVFKCDGYWLVADALGVANLSAQPRVLARAIVRRIRDSRAVELPWPPLVAAVLALYSVASIGVWLWFVSRLAPMLVVRFASLDVQLAAVVEAFHGRGAGPWQACLGLAVSLFLLTVTAVLIGRLGQALAPAALKPRLASLAGGVAAASVRAVKRVCRELPPPWSFGRRNT